VSSENIHIHTVLAGWLDVDFFLFLAKFATHFIGTWEYSREEGHAWVFLGEVCISACQEI